MTFLKRLKNLWRLSEFTPALDENSPNIRNPTGEFVTAIKKPIQPKLAEIITKKHIKNAADEFNGE